MNIQNKTVTILGAKRSGFALARLVLKLGGTPKLSDQAPREMILAEHLAWADHHNVALELGGHSKKFIQEADYIILSPGISVMHPIVVEAKEKNIPVLGEIEFASQFVTKPIIAITGSNGKTTVSTLTKEVLQQAGHRVRLCGNIGDPFSDYCLESAKVDYFVLEVSSFQMESILGSSDLISAKGFHPDIAVLLNFNENHLDRHADLEEYFQAKIKIFQNQTTEDMAILNANDARTKELAKLIQARIYIFDGKRVENANFAAVEKIAEILNIEKSVLKVTFDNFKGVQHRLEWVRSLNGVDFVNDSKATTAESGRWALEHIHQPIYMICGGRDKNIDFSVIKDIVAKKVKHIFAIGEAREKILTTFQEIVQVDLCDELGEAILKARDEAQAGDCVVMSPMCASFDMFQDYEDRGRAFKHIVESLS